MSPTTHLLSRLAACTRVAVVRAGEGCTRGSAGRVGTGGCYTGTPPVPSQDTIFSIFWVQGPTHGQMKAILEVLLRFPRMGLERVPERVQNGLRMTLR